MKKFLAILLAALMVFGLAACGEVEEGGETVTGVDAIADEMTSEDGTYEVAFVTDVGQLKDKSFNQGTYDGVKEFAYANGYSYKYYQPANGDQATDDDRYDAMKAAADNGAKVIVCAGFLQATALEKAAKEFTDVTFVFIDGWAMGLDNVIGLSYKEEQAGYLAGYAVVKEGFTKLGFSGGGGGNNAACCRYGYGFVQGANAAAAEMGVDVEVNYTWLYGASFSASAELQTLISGWYENGTEVVFSCGGSIFQSITAAAAENDGKVIGVDVDQSPDSATVITSAMKGLQASVVWACEQIYAGNAAELAATGVSLGADNDAVGLPTETWALANWTVEEYEALFADIVAGNVAIDNTVMEAGAVATVDFSNVTVNYVE